MSIRRSRAGRNCWPTFAALDRTVGRMAAAAALGQLERIAHETIFQPEGGAPPVQVLGVLEANALTFDHVWIMGLTAEAWPPPSQPDPLLPIELQRAAGMPGASATAELERARRQLQRLLQSAPEVIVSHATVDVDRQIAPSPMIASFDEWIAPPRAARLIDVMAPAALTVTRDAVAPAMARHDSAARRGGDFAESGGVPVSRVRNSSTERQSDRVTARRFRLSRARAAGARHAGRFLDLAAGANARRAGSNAGGAAAEAATRRRGCGAAAVATTARYLLRCADRARVSASGARD